MITARDPRSGVSITYNDATHFVYPAGTERFYILQDKDDAFVAVVPDSMIVEYVEPCKIENVLEGLTVESAVVLLCGSIREARDRVLVAKLKRILRKFDSRTFQWKR